MMARIDIDYEEYQNLKDRINKLEIENIKLRSEISSQRQKIFDCKNVIEDIKESGFFERVFSWENVLKDANNLKF